MIKLSSQGDTIATCSTLLKLPVLTLLMVKVTVDYNICRAGSLCIRKAGFLSSAFVSLRGHETEPNDREFQERN
jgi:hypothetical protein